MVVMRGLRLRKLTAGYDVVILTMPEELTEVIEAFAADPLERDLAFEPTTRQAKAIIEKINFIVYIQTDVLYTS